MDSAKVLIFLGLVCVCWGKSLPALMRNPEDKLLKIQVGQCYLHFSLVVVAQASLVLW